jgi:hypothetical protein
MSEFQTIEQIKTAVDNGLPVKWANRGYDVIRDKIGRYLIIFRPNNHAIGLTDISGNKLNGDIERFYIEGEG